MQGEKLNVSKEKWIIDGGVSDHITGDSKLFHEYRLSYRKDKVVIADESHISMIWKKYCHSPNLCWWYDHRSDDEEEVDQLKNNPSTEFNLKELRKLRYFIDIEMTRSNIDLVIN